MAYVGETGCSIKSSTIDSSILNKPAIAEHGINTLPMDKGVLARKYSHINYIMWDMIVIGLCCDVYCLSKLCTPLNWNAGVCIGCA
jgi:hypothetical protein